MDLNKKEVFALLVFVLVLFSFVFVNSAIEVELQVPNSPPYLLYPIPNQTWATGQNKTDAFDLDSYFKDDNGDSLNFTYTSVGNIDIIINSTTHKVSFYPDEYFSGIRTVTFYASDGIINISSNLVYLQVGMDTTPPTWHTISKSKPTIYQNDMVLFSTLWRDDFELGSYIFSINQGTWANYSKISFSGIENTSTTSLQISAPPSNIVYWRFYAFDSSGNMNLTNIQSFTVSSETISPGGGTGTEEDDWASSEDEEGILNTIIEPFKITRKTYDFKLNVFDYKLSLKQGGLKTVILKITNTGLGELNFNLSSEKISSFVVFSEESFTLMPGKSKEITIDFYSSATTFPGQYFGFIVVDAEKIKKSIPVVLDIKSIDLDFDVNLTVLPKTKIVKTKEEVKAKIDVFNIKDLGEVNATMYYAVKDFTGKIINFSEENITFYSSISFERALQIPELTEPGQYIFYLRVSNSQNLAIDSDRFEIGIKFKVAAFLKTSSIFILIIVFGFLIASFMVKYSKDKKKERILELYMSLSKLKVLLNQNKFEEAIQLYAKVKMDYGEPLSPDVLKDKEKFKQEITDLYNKTGSMVDKINKLNKEETTQKPTTQMNNQLKKPLAKNSGKVLPKKNSVPAKKIINPPQKAPIKKEMEKKPLPVKVIPKKEPIKNTKPLLKKPLNTKPSEIKQLPIKKPLKKKEIK